MGAARLRAPSRAAPRLPESALYAPVKAFLEARGYTAKGEICGCDVAAVAAGEAPRLVVAELKLSFSLELVLQAVDRMAVADEVWLAVRAARHGPERDRRARRLCRLLGLGLLAVDAVTGTVEVLAEPGPYRPRGDAKRRRRVLKEHSARQGDPASGGASRVPIMTAYRQRALLCAAELAAGPRRVADLAGRVPDAGQILLRNVYGWFERERRGVYRLSDSGQGALKRWPPVVSAPVDTDRQENPPLRGRMASRPE